MNKEVAQFDRSVIAPPPQIGRKRHKSAAGFTLVEIMIAVSIFSIISIIVADLYIQSFRGSSRANNQNQIYEDARFIMQEIGNEIQNGMIDYDEYYNKNVVIPTLKSSGLPGIDGAERELRQNYGQNFGRYYSAFFNPGTIFNSTTNKEVDDGLGFQCNNGERNKNDCTPLRKTIDRNTGSNPFSGKYDMETIPEENAFCGSVSYSTGNTSGPNPPCDTTPLPEPELYLISADSFQKTILAREKTGDSAWALSILRLKGIDTGNDGIPDKFVCGDDFICTGDELPPYGKLPKLDKPDSDPPIVGDLNNVSDDTQPDSKADGFTKDFVPISSLRVNVSDLKFYISPGDDPTYAFAEETSANQQPHVKIILTVAGIGNNTSSIPPVTLVKTVYTRMLTPIKAPITVF